MEENAGAAVTETVEPDGSRKTQWRFPATREKLEPLLRDLFENHYAEIVFGPCVQGSVFEVHSEEPPERISYLDGYLTVDFGRWHLHLCIGEHKGEPGNPCPEELARHRQCSRAALARIYTPRPSRAHPPVSYSLGLWNGRDEQMITFFLPNPWLTEKMRVTAAPDWTRLRLWNHIRTRHLGLEEDPGPFEGME